MVETSEKIGDVEAKLKVGYAGILHQRYPFNPEDMASFNDENAYTLALEREYLDIPRDLELDRLLPSIPEKHHQRMQKIWDSVEKYYLTFDLICKNLEKKWTTDVPTESLDDFSKTITDSSNIKINPRFRNGIRAIIADSSDKEDLSSWQLEEKSLRDNLFKTSKKYFVTLRLYYEMLLESNPEKDTQKTTDEDYVLPSNHPARQEIARRNNYLRFIDAAHQGIGIGKTAHHGQEKGRLRKTENIPYIVHGMDVANAVALDVLPFTLDAGMAKLAVILALVGPIHDVIEDTNLTLEEICGDGGYIRNIADKYDSRIDPLIESGWAPLKKAANDNAESSDTPEEKIRNSRAYIKRKVLNLLKDDTLDIIREVLRLLSNNIKWSREEKVKATRQSIAGKEITMKILGITPGEYKNWKGIQPNLQTKTFDQFPDEPDDKDNKSTAFLMRLNAMHGAESRQIALMLKLEDRANNILTISKMAPGKQLPMLRSTTSRIIAWAMLDHDHSKRPLYNSLPRCIDTTLKAYEELYKTTPEMIAPLDHVYIGKLKEWQTTVKRFEVPAKVQAILKENRALQAKESLQAA